MPKLKLSDRARPNTQFSLIKLIQTALLIYTPTISTSNQEHADILLHLNIFIEPMQKHQICYSSKASTNIYHNYNSHLQSIYLVRVRVQN